MDFKKQKRFTRTKIDNLFQQGSDSDDSLEFEGLDAYKKEAENIPITYQNIPSSSFSCDKLLQDSLNSPKKNYSKKSYFKNRVGHRHIPLKDKIVLSDIETYYKFGVFPYIFFIHIGIIVLTTLIVRYLTINFYFFLYNFYNDRL